MSIRPLFLTPVIAAFLQAAVLNAQTTNPLDLLKEAAAPGERIAYGSGALQFGELRVPDAQGSRPLGFSCTAAAGGPGLDNYRNEVMPAVLRSHGTCQPPPESGGLA